MKTKNFNMAYRAVHVMTLKPPLVPHSASYVGLTHPCPTLILPTPSHSLYHSLCLSAYLKHFSFFLHLINSSSFRPQCPFLVWGGGDDSSILVISDSSIMGTHCQSMATFFLFYTGLVIVAVYTVCVIIWFCLVVAISVHICSWFLSFQASSSSTLPYQLEIRWVSVSALASGMWAEVTYVTSCPRFKEPVYAFLPFSSVIGKRIPYGPGMWTSDYNGRNPYWSLKTAWANNEPSLC